MGPMRRVGMFSIAIVGTLLSCGGAQAPAQEPPGDRHATGEGAVDDLDLPAGMEGESMSPEQEAGEAPGDAVEETPPAVTFQLVNQADEDLVFSVEKGWQTVFIAFSGQPPKAKPILMFPKHCTASCELSAEEVCPVCQTPETVREVKAAEKQVVVAPGASLEVPWDGQVLVYEKTRGKRNGRTQRCECYRTEEVPPETYTVRACGLRLTKSASKSTRLQCADTTMTAPSGEPQVVTLEFPAP